jgi:hypothetical protein
VGLDTLVEAAGEAADRSLVADVGVAQAARGEAAQAPAGIEEDHRAAHAARLHGRDHAGRVAAVHDDVEALGDRRGRGRRPEAQQEGQRRKEAGREGHRALLPWGAGVATRGGYQPGGINGAQEVRS